MPEWNEALETTRLLIRDRRNWQDLMHEDPSRCSDGVIVANAASASREALRVLERLCNSPLKSSPEIIRLGAQVMDDFLLWPVHGEEFWTSMAMMGEVLKPGGLLLITARGNGFWIHGYPHDYYRFLPESFNCLLRYAGCDALEVTETGSPATPESLA